MSIFNTLKNNLANYFTLGNLACGFLGIILVLTNPSVLPFWLMIVAAILDFLDGFIARLTKTTSKIGADLDSLADMVTFGVLPGVMVYFMFPTPYNYLSVLVPVFSAWRLAKFNNDTRSSDLFYGLPTPANALLIAGIYATYIKSGTRIDGMHFYAQYSQNYIWFAPTVIILCFLMVSNIELISNKISNFSIAKYKWHLAIAILGLILIFTYGYLGLSLAIISYVLISIIITFVPLKKSSL